MADIYNIDYYEKMLRQNSATAEIISSIRWNFVHFVDPKTVLDYGSGVGWFRAFSPANIDVDSFDIMQVTQTGVRKKSYDLLTLWDVLEHIPDFSVLDNIFESVSYIGISVPIKPNTIRMGDWKHYKPGEHLTCFTRESLEAFFSDRGFFHIKGGTPECDCGIREDIYSALYKHYTE